MVCRELPTKGTWEMFTKRELTLQQEHGRLLQPLALSAGPLGRPYSPKQTLELETLQVPEAPAQLHLSSTSQCV